MAEIAFRLNGTPVRIADPDPTRTLLDWLREDRGLRGTKEGCNEGDCGACSVIVTDGRGPRALNACILLLPQLHGASVRTVEGIAGPDGALHPVQSAMIAHHGSQCGFCTPGFVTTMACGHMQGRRDHDDMLAGNLCRCTGYAPIVRAAKAAEAEPVPAWMTDRPSTDLTAPPASTQDGADTARAAASAPPPLSRLRGSSGGEHAGARGADAPPAALYRPATSDDLARTYLDHPDATLIAGATDVGLWVTKGLRTLGPVVFLGQVADLRRIDRGQGRIRVGAGVTIADLRAEIATDLPAFADLLRRYGGEQVRNAATIGGNIANGSPIGDGPPALMALGATLHLRRGDETRDMDLEAFFLDYRRQDLRPSEFVTGVSFRTEAPGLRCYKVSKRFDQDISAVCGCFDVEVTEGTVTQVRIAFGGMAGIPKRAARVEASLRGQPWSLAAVQRALPAFAEDFSPLSDMRASSGYRLTVARNLLVRYFHDLAGAAVSVLGVAS